MVLRLLVTLRAPPQATMPASTALTESISSATRALRLCPAASANPNAMARDDQSANRTRRSDAICPVPVVLTETWNISLESLPRMEGAPRVTDGCTLHAAPCGAPLHFRLIVFGLPVTTRL